MTKLIYTVNISEYDKTPPALIQSEGFKHIIFTDNAELKVKGWETHYIPPSHNPILQSREIKINIHKFHEADLYVYIDANYEIKRDLNQYIKRHFKGGLSVAKHPKRKCIYEEAKEVIQQGKAPKERVENQVAKYRKQKMPLRFGLYECGFIIRDNSVNGLCELWYNEVEQGSYRDQIALPYVLFKTKYKVNRVSAAPSRQYLKLHPRVKKYDQLNDFKVWHFVPASGDKNLGRSYNQHCEVVPDNDWILIRDGDTMFLHSQWPKQIEDIIRKHGKEYPLISCVTNRLGLSWQTPYGISDNPNVLDHYEIAMKHYEDYYDVVDKSPKPTAGLFMLFPKNTWNEIKFAEGLTGNGKFIDWQFSESVKRKFGKIGIAKGIYLFHFYRFAQENIKEFNHLK